MLTAGIVAFDLHDVYLILHKYIGNKDLKLQQLIYINTHYIYIMYYVGIYSNILKII